MPSIENLTDQRYILTRSLVLKAKEKGAPDDEREVVLELDRITALKLYTEAIEEKTAEVGDAKKAEALVLDEWRRRPVLVIDLAVRANEAGVPVADLLASLKRDKLIQQAIAKGRLRLTE